MGRWDIKWSNMGVTDLWIVDKESGKPLALNRSCSDGDFMEAIEKLHNADVDAYEARIAELEAELARVKGESLRVVVDGEACDILAAKSQYVTDEDGELWECHPEPADDGREVRSVLTGCGGYFAATIVQPVRLERWED